MSWLLRSNNMFVASSIQMTMNRQKKSHLNWFCFEIIEKIYIKVWKKSGNIPAKGKSEVNGIPLIFAESQTFTFTTALALHGYIYMKLECMKTS